MQKSITAWLKAKLEKSGCAGFVVGVSGGIDSAVTAALARKASPNTLALVMPCESHKNDTADAMKLIRKFKIKYRVVNLNGPYASLKKAMGVKLTRGAAGNLKARLRMTVLYSFANSMNLLVAGTSNKTETVFGYFTKYGDGAADILPLASFVKSGVRKLASELGVPKAIIEKAPSAGLWKGQTDEDEMGITYEVLDGLVRNMSSIKKLDKTQRKRAEELLRTNAHKLKPPEVFKH